MIRVLRGGTWFGPAGDCRSSYRSRRRPDSRNSNVGFRLVRLLSQ
ncbi:SUMF1/EgtB/PvdO family nonheme iron enzyme [uncultured Desulfobacter sp.]